MKGPRYPGETLVMSLMMLGAVGAVGVQAGLCEDVGKAGGNQASMYPPAVAANAPSGKTAAGHSAGMRVYVNPETGAIEPPPAGSAPVGAAASQDALNSSSAGLVAVEGPTEGSGVMVDLQGRFQSTVGVEIGADGSVLTRCDSRVPQASEKK